MSASKSKTSTIRGNTRNNDLIEDWSFIQNVYFREHDSMSIWGIIEDIKSKLQEMKDNGMRVKAIILVNIAAIGDTILDIVGRE